MTCEQIVGVWSWIGWVFVAIGTALFVGDTVLFGLSFINDRTSWKARTVFTWIGIWGFALAYMGDRMVRG